MQCILTALKAESQPLIDHYGLKRDSVYSFPVFKKNDLCLIGLGVGKKNIHNRISTFYNSVKPDYIQFINIGIAGGNPSTTEIGNCYVLNQIQDLANEQTYYADCLIKHDFEERSLVTVEEVFSDGADNFPGLVDMEASEIFKVCASLTSVHRLAFLKIVSDHMDMDFNKILALPISKMISDHIKLIDLFLSRFKTLSQLETPILSEKDKKWSEELVKKLSLTETQSQQLFHYTKGFRLRNRELCFPEIDQIKPKSKADRNHLFKEICDRLST